MYLQRRLIVVFLVSIVSLQATFNWEFDNAVCNDDIAKVKAMLEQDNSLAKQCDSNRHTALHWVKSRTMAELLVSYGADIYARNKWNDTPLHYASHCGYKEVLEFFLDKGMDINIRGNKNSTALRRASWNNHLEIVKYLIKKGAPVNVQSGLDNYTPLHGAVDAENLEMVQFLVKEAKIDTCIRTTSGKTALEYAKGILPQAKDKEAMRSIITYLETVTPLHTQSQLSLDLKHILFMVLAVLIVCYIIKKTRDRYQHRKYGKCKNDLVSTDGSEVIFHDVAFNTR